MHLKYFLLKTDVYLKICPSVYINNNYNWHLYDVVCVIQWVAVFATQLAKTNGNRCKNRTQEEVMAHHS